METEVDNSKIIAKDVEVTIILRSGQTDLKNLMKLMKSVKDLSNLSIDSEIVLTETEMRITSTQGKDLTVIRHRFLIV